MTNAYTVDVVIPIFNNEKYIAKCIDGVLAQTFTINKIIIVNDGSTDNSEKIIKEYAKKHKNIIYIKQTNQGPSEARNNGFKITTANYVALLDADDIWYPNKIAEQIEIYKQGNEKLGIVHCNYEIIDANDNFCRNAYIIKAKKRGNIFDAILFENYGLAGSASAVLIKKEFIDKVGLFDTKIYHGEDWDFYLKLANICEVDFVDKTLVQIRTHPQSLQLKNRKDKLNEIFIQEIYILSKWQHKFNKNNLYKLKQRIVRRLLTHIFYPHKIFLFYKEIKETRLFNNKIEFYYHLILSLIKSTPGKILRELNFKKYWM